MVSYGVAYMRTRLLVHWTASRVHAGHQARRRDRGEGFGLPLDVSAGRLEAGDAPLQPINPLIERRQG